MVYPNKCCFQQIFIKDSEFDMVFVDKIVLSRASVISRISASFLTKAASEAEKSVLFISLTSLAFFFGFSLPKN
jgi:hypothetical protein